MAHDVLEALCLECKAHIHYLCGMAVSRGKVNESAFCKEIKYPAVLHTITHNIRLALPYLVSLCLKRMLVYFNVEMSRICKQSTVAHNIEMLRADNITAPGNGNEQIAELGSLVHRHYRKAVHYRLDCTDGIDLCHDNACAHTLCTHRNALSTPAVACDNNIFACNDKVC